MWQRISSAAAAIFERARRHCLERGLILADTKCEFGVDDQGELMLIDEVLTPECSRFLTPGGESGKDALLDWLDSRGFSGQGTIPAIDAAVRDRVLADYAASYRIITGREPPCAADAAEVSRAAARLVAELAAGFPQRN